MKEIYKIFARFYHGRKDSGQMVLCEDFYSLQDVNKKARELLKEYTCYLEIKKYSNFPAVIGCTSADNGETISYESSCLSFQAVKEIYAPICEQYEKMAREVLEKILTEYGFPFVWTSLVDNDYCDRNGKLFAPPEEAYKERLYFAVIAGCQENEKETLRNILKSYGYELCDDL